MNPCIVSFFMDNVDKRTVELQQQVIAKFNKSKVHQYTIKVDFPHHVSLDYFWAMNGVRTEPLKDIPLEQTLHHDVILFLDIDCVPLNDSAIDTYIALAQEGALVGNAQRTNHLDNGQHVFAAPSALAISKETYLKIGKPTAFPNNQRSDVAEEYTWAAEQNGVPVYFSMPMRYDSPPNRFEWEKDQPPYWALADGMPAYGVGTTFGMNSVEMFYHNFQIFHQGQQERFQNKCLKLLENVP